MRLRFKSMLMILGLMIIACMFIGGGYLFYQDVTYNDTAVIVDGSITVNYLNGSEFNLDNSGSVTFSVTNNSDDKAYYYIQLSDIKGASENVIYELKDDEGEVDISDNLKADIISTSIEIAAKTTTNYTINFKTEDLQDNYSGKIIVGSIPKEKITFAETILANNEVKDQSLTLPGELAIENEGLIKDIDNLGDAYYFRGNVSNNYVMFANNLWRIVKINGDGSIKIVLNNVIDILTKYTEDDIAFADSIIKDSLDNWFNLTLADYTDYISTYKFCNDLSLTGNDFNAYNRIYIDKIPVQTCLGEEISSKIGLLTADEVMYAGGSFTKNESYYLYNSDIKTAYFTLTSAKKTTEYYPFIVNPDGAINMNTEGSLLRAARPVINIIANITVTGLGTIDDPYILNLE